MKDISVNKALWDDLSPEQQKILEDSVDAFTEQLVTDLQKKDEEQVALARQKGDVTLTSLPEDEVKKFRQSARDEWSRWRDRSPRRRRRWIPCRATCRTRACSEPRKPAIQSPSNQRLSGPCRRVRGVSLGKNSIFV